MSNNAFNEAGCALLDFWVIGLDSNHWKCKLFSLIAVLPSHQILTNTLCSLASCLRQVGRLMKKARHSRLHQSSQSSHLIVLFVRTIHQAKFILSDTRKRTNNPMQFEALLLLKVNGSLWNLFPSGKPRVNQRYQDLKLVVALTMRVMLSCCLILTL